jgi:hypothetical protein
MAWLKPDDRREERLAGGAAGDDADVAAEPTFGDARGLVGERELERAIRRGADRTEGHGRAERDVAGGHDVVGACDGHRRRRGRGRGLGADRGAAQVGAGRVGHLDRAAGSQR